MRTFLLLLATTLLSVFSIAQNDLNDIVEKFVSNTDLNMSRLEKLEAIRANTSMDSLKREKKWKKAYEKWDKDDTTAHFLVAGSILSSIGPESWKYSKVDAYPDFSNEYLNWLVDMRVTQGKGLEEQTLMFIRNVLKRRIDVSEELIKKECENIFIKANRFGSDTPIYPDHFAVMVTYLQNKHPECEDIVELIEVVKRYKADDLDKLISNAEKSRLSLDQLNTIPPLRRYSTNLIIGRSFRDDLIKSFELYRHSHKGRTYFTAELWDAYKYKMYHRFFENEQIGNMLLGMVCYKKWLEYEHKKLDTSTSGSYVKGVTRENPSYIYDQLQKSQTKQLRLNMPAEHFKPHQPFSTDLFTQLLVAASNGVFFLPTDLRPKTIKDIESIEVKNFQLTEKERTVVNGIGPYRIRYQAERILKDNTWLAEHAKNPEFRFAVLLKLAQTAMRCETDWYGKANDYERNPFTLEVEPAALMPSMEELKKKENRLNEIKQSLATSLENLGVRSGKYVITCEGRRNVEVYPEMEYGMNARIMGELERLGVESSREYGFPGYSRFVVYVNEAAPEISYIGEIVEDGEVKKEYYPIPPSPPPPPPLVEDEPRRIEQKVIDFPDVEASFPGGAAAMKKWLEDNLNYPEESITLNEQGRVYVSFVVEIDGNISNVKVERGVSKALDAEAKRLIRSMPKWTAGEIRGMKVRTRCRLPVVFRIP